MRRCVQHSRETHITDNEDQIASAVENIHRSDVQQCGNQEAHAEKEGVRRGVR